ncbi:MAG: EF-hand domain-containing protein [Planktotalea sp.]|uniref:EF-hand domain-containing protein n=1 Tax=Planktotalea sp. TaxID=2029877 RepID=UPI003C71FA60
MFTKATLTLAAISLASASFAMSDADANGDKMLTLDEMKSAYPEISEDQFMQADADSDGILSEQELANAVESGVLPQLDD